MRHTQEQNAEQKLLHNHTRQGLGQALSQSDPVIPVVGQFEPLLSIQLLRSHKT
jgi:hypothetical protein